jgi:lysophospholipase L1-like esterase
VDPNQDPLFKEQQQSDPDGVFRSAIEELCRMAQRHGVKPVLLFLPTLDDLASTNTSRVLAVKRAVSAKLGVPLVDLSPDLAAAGKSLYLEADPVHLNAAGNELVARRLFETITNGFAK